MKRLGCGMMLAMNIASARSFIIRLRNPGS
jgi:hypothetical protein